MDEMTTQAQDLDTQIAVHLFGWRWLDAAQLWRDPDGLVCDAQTFLRRLPSYSRVPDATALVWQWLEGQRMAGNWQITFAYWPQKVSCRLTKYVGVYTVAHQEGASWPEALCRAALALAEALEETP